VPFDSEKTQILTVDDTRPAVPESVDFDFDPVRTATSTVASDPDATVMARGDLPQQAAPSSATDMDFTLDFGAPGNDSVPKLPDLPLEPALDGTATSGADMSIDMPLDSSTGNVVDPGFNPQATNVLLDSGPPTGSILDFKLEAAKAEAAEAATAGAGQPTLPPMSQDTMIMANPGELVTFDMTHPAGLPQNWQETTLPRVDLDLGDSNVDGRNPNRDERWNDVNTKYDLAKAYEEMGDKDGAREILREVMAEGDEQQKAEAESMLARLG
jgi:pilus assembly protein FimV